MRQVSSPPAKPPVESMPLQQGSTLSARGSTAASPWPEDLLESFCLRMSSQGMCVSRSLMQNNRRYGLEQLAHAHNMADDTLRLMAVQLFRCFESRQSGISDSH